MKSYFTKFIRITAVTIAFLTMVMACKPDQSAPAPSFPYRNIQGKTVYLDYYKNDTAILDSQAIFIRYDSTDTAIIYSVLTDINGYFVFSVNPAKKYIIYSRPAIAGASYFFADTITDYSNDTIRLTAVDTNQENGIAITAVDVAGIGLSGVSVFLYTSEAIAFDDSAFTGVGAIAKTTTDSKGKALVTKLPAGILYVNAVLQITPGNLLQVKNDTVNLAKKGPLRSKTIQLR